MDENRAFRYLMIGAIMMLSSFVSEVLRAQSTLIKPTICNPGLCFINEQAKNTYAAKNNCVFKSQKNNNDCSEKWRSSDDFLKDSEGDLIEEGYVPQYIRDVKDKNGKIIHKKGDVIGASGVTISTGIDLGQQSKSGTHKIINNYIKEFGNSDNVDVSALMKKLDPYFGPEKQGKKALDALAASAPLNVSSPEAKLLGDAFGLDVQNKIAKQFDKNNTQGMTFKILPEQAQTAIVDFAYQYGMSDSKGTIRQKFWDYVYAGKWQNLATWLKSHPDPYESRRQREGDRLQKGIDIGSLPTIGNPCANSDRNNSPNVAAVVG